MSELSQTSRFNSPSSGLHHVTALCTAPQANYDFYHGVLGLRLVKLTVNFDDPGTYHLYYGDGAGRPGTILTFFAWPGARRAARGKGSVTAVAFAIPPGATEYWAQRLKAASVTAWGVRNRLGQNGLQFTDPDGLLLELLESALGEAPLAENSTAITALHSVTIATEGYERTATVLTQWLGFLAEETSPSPAEPNRFRFRSRGGRGDVVDLQCVPDAPRNQGGAGGVHHVAFRVGTDAEQLALRHALVKEGFNVSPVMDRTYFRSIYFREPGGVLFEVATDAPGFSVDESEATMGSTLKLPAWLENRRQEIAGALPPLETRPWTPLGS